MKKEGYITEEEREKCQKVADAHAKELDNFYELLRKRLYLAEKAGIAINPFHEKINYGKMNKYENEKQIES